MFHSGQVYMFLVEYISLSVLQNSPFSLEIKNFEKCLQVIFFVKLRLEPSNFTKNELRWKHFSDNFTYIQSICSFQNIHVWNYKAPIM